MSQKLSSASVFVPRQKTAQNITDSLPMKNRAGQQATISVSDSTKYVHIFVSIDSLLGLGLLIVEACHTTHTTHTHTQQLTQRGQQLSCVRGHGVLLTCDLH